MSLFCDQDFLTRGGLRARLASSAWRAWEATVEELPHSAITWAAGVGFVEREKAKAQQVGDEKGMRQEGAMKYIV